MVEELSTILIFDNFWQLRKKIRIFIIKFTLESDFN